ncbi:Mis14 domain protein [Blumeria hordei DH14]|uniref:Mis14 domain protein n=1 Tax=Blumeria graminis f. sp. hordei (strain DH14) TaxID=546991 RepID=N1JD88_BLUG1|nr:Mis14 domain protein [Blumeria hordei DH14]
MTEFQRKIELQSLEDFQYLVTKIRRAAQAKIDMDLPPMEGEDPMRKRVEALYITKVLESVSANIAINGLDPSPSLIHALLHSTTNKLRETEEHEPFDTRLLERAKDLARQEEDLVEEIAALRRLAPAQIFETVKSAYSQSLETDEQIIRNLEQHAETSEQRPINLGIQALERQEMVEGDWARSVQGLKILMHSIPEMVAKKERAEMVEEYVLRDNI